MHPKEPVSATRVGWVRIRQVFTGVPETHLWKRIKKRLFQTRLNFSKELVSVLTTVCSHYDERNVCHFPPPCVFLSLFPDKLHYPGQTYSITVWDASVLKLICLWAFLFYFLSRSFSLAFQKTEKKKKKGVKSWSAEVFYRMFRTKRVMQGLPHFDVNHLLHFC